MDTSWWPALAAVVALALVVLVAGRRRPEARPRPPAVPEPAHRPGPPPRPRAGDIWWADVPFEDGPGSKDRPCLVLGPVRHGHAHAPGRGGGEAAGRMLVVKITSKYHDERPGVIPLPPGTVGDARGRAAFLETDELREVSVWGFRRRVGPVDPAIWDQVRHLAR
ncbi:type II toxin-antitoxin system PemK/MazF family toxin [Streptomyces sp. NPDC097619]|uniref:type II toxin-antitoxin system PemK/MazF family toxin n=1 Tax=Streptomyces sp. NPDC097619 TaxID=3157228 RepID=UPI00331CAEC8